MRFSNVLSTGILAMSATGVMAHPLEHQHNIHKRDDAVFVTVKVTQYVDAAGNVLAQPTTVVDHIPAAAASNVDNAGSAQTISIAQAAAAVTTTSVAAEAPTTAEVSSTTAAESSAPVSVGSGGAAGMVYSPYNSDGTCKSTSQVASDLSQLTGFPLIRIYGVDCNQVANVLAALGAGQKLFVGIYDVSALTSALDTISSAVSTYASWDVIDTISVGNELVNNGSKTVAEITSLCSEARSYARSLGFTGPVVSVDTFIAVINNPGLCDASDYIAVNAHAFFDGYVTADQAGDWVLLQIQRVWSACGGKKRVMITESGWPSKGDSNNVAVPSDDNQRKAVDSIKKVCGGSTILFTAFNDFWKAPGPFNAEQYWGMLN
ncbi:soluble cell wall protein [Nadsonia fulvescens var. elongata DSM 6958]|uniref:Soluble cell wall protein n=1 Tax=Nadsonia fulvescens var. elongata DSM 6958 TaxID=857566 RepID=A0A1E3PPF1_9ASCO|nr:soluble cell wall protein [Nadsonia fulvescens var. elongata DSM 6958]